LRQLNLNLGIEFVHLTIVEAPNKKEKKMTLRLTDLAPNFDAETTQGKINFH